MAVVISAKKSPTLVDSHVVIGDEPSLREGIDSKPMNGGRTRPAGRDCKDSAEERTRTGSARSGRTTSVRILHRVTIATAPRADDYQRRQTLAGQSDM